VIYPNVRHRHADPRRLIAHGRTVEEVCREITADALCTRIWTRWRAISDVNPALTNFEASCFDGVYVTGDVTRSIWINWNTSVIIQARPPYRKTQAVRS
jgi:amidophosphoribosyltransferase